MMNSGVITVILIPLGITRMLRLRITSILCKFSHLTLLVLSAAFARLLPAVRNMRWEIFMRIINSHFVCKEGIKALLSVSGNPKLILISLFHRPAEGFSLHLPIRSRFTLLLSQALGLHVAQGLGAKSSSGFWKRHRAKKGASRGEKCFEKGLDPCNDN
jgi:hypothetical protein